MNDPKCICGATVIELHDPSGAIEYVCTACGKRAWLSDLAQEAMFNLILTAL